MQVTGCRTAEAGRLLPQRVLLDLVQSPPSLCLLPCLRVLPSAVFCPTTSLTFTLRDHKRVLLFRFSGLGMDFPASFILSFLKDLPCGSLALPCLLPCLLLSHFFLPDLSPIREIRVFVTCSHLVFHSLPLNTHVESLHGHLSADDSNILNHVFSWFQQNNLDSLTQVSTREFSTKELKFNILNIEF